MIPFELVDYVKKGLIPHDQLGKPRLPNYVENMLRFHKNMKKGLVVREFKETVIERLSGRSGKNWFENLPKHLQMIQETDGLKNKLLKNPSEAWKIVELLDKPEEAKAEIKILVNSYYKKNQVAEFEKKLQPIGSNKKLRPSQKAKIECRKVAEKLWEKHPNMTIADMIMKDEIVKACENKIYAEKTIRDWIKDLCPNRSPGRRKQT
jgi:hypothetical protein